MNGTSKYYPEWGNPITKEHTWYAFNKWILDKKLGIPKIQFTNHMKLKRMKTTVWLLRFFLEGGVKIPMRGDTETMFGAKLKERPSSDCPTWGSIPYTVTKRRHYCECQDVLANRSLILAVSWEALQEPDKYRCECSQSSIELSTGFSMEELGKGLKEMKGFAAP